MDNITNIKNVDPETLEFQEYQDADNSLISSFDVSDVAFKPEIDALEFHVFDSNKNIVFSEYNFKKYSLIDNNLVIDNKENLTSYGFEEGQYYTLYNFIIPLFNSNSEQRFYISEISSDRTELRLSSNVIVGLKEAYNTFVSSSNTVQYYKDFYLNFGDNNLIISNNVLLDGDDILIKLYEPLSPQFDIKSELWVIEKLAESIAYFFDIITVLTEDNDIIQIQGPNLNVAIKDKISNSTGYLNYDALNNSPSSSLTNQLNNILSKKAIRLNIDHSDYANFIHFSSAETRLENFVYKLSLIETYNYSALSSSYTSTNYYLTESKNIYTNKIKDIVEGFDNYEYHLYFNSGSSSWPKSNSILPYVNYSSTSSAGLSWLSGQLNSASFYDLENKDNLINTIPSYLREDPRNAPYELYVEMLGQHFDTLYLYTSELNNKYNSDNRIDYGMSKDLISDALKDFGIKIYQNNFSSNDLYTSFLGINPNLGLLPPTGSELISTYTTASSQVIPLEDVNTEIYKRIYHNLPLLLKKKGTIEGLKLLINTYGIPNTVLRVNEFGGKNRNESNNWDQFQNQFNYTFYTTSSGFVKVATPIIASSPVRTVEFRFKTTGIPTNLSQSLAHLSSSYGLNVVLEYTGSGYTSSSYSSSIVDPFNEYGTLKFIDSITNTSSSLYLPFFDGGWWSVMVNVNDNAPYTSSLFAKNKIYSGYDGKQIGFEASTSISSSNWYPSNQTFFLSHSGSLNLLGKTYQPFSGSFQELRFYKTKLNESVFDDFVMNPHSIEGNDLEVDNSYNSLIFRAPLGSVLENNLSASRTSIHPSVNTTQSFGSITSSIYTLSGSYTFIPNKEVYYYDQFPAGIKNIISNKVSYDNTIVPEGDTLSPYISIQQNYPISESHTRDVNYVEVGFSPQNEINEDIISQLGNFNIGNYIGDPRQLVNKNTTQYVDFNKLRDSYFRKYNTSFNLGDYIRLIKYFDNSLFKLIKDFVPVRTSLATGIIIKQHLLERNRYSPAQADFEPQDYSGSIKSQANNFVSGSIYKISSRNGGMMPSITQSYTESFIGPTGISSIIHVDNNEFLTGEFKGAKITCTTSSLNPSNPFLDVNVPYFEYKVKFYYDYVNEYNYLNYMVPVNGTILFTPNYAKISKYDINGNINLNLNSLNSLNSFTIKFSDNSISEYKILSRTDNGNYFTYRIEQNISGLQSDGIVLNYKMSSSFSSSVSSSSGPSSNNLNLIPINTVYTDVRGFLTSSFVNWIDPHQMDGVTGSFYTFVNDYPNINLYISASVTFDTTSPSYNPVLYLLKVPNFTDSQTIATLQNGVISPMELISQVVGVTNSSTQTLRLISVITPTSGDAYFVAFGSSIIDSSITASNFTFSITQSSNSNVGTQNLTIFNPSLTEKFEGNDYDVLYGNIDSISPSQYYEKIDYINYGINNSYFQQILSRSAIPADVKDYNYYLKRQIYPRYMGSRNSSDNFNTSSCENVKSLQTSLKLHLGPSMQQGVASCYNTTIFEFNNGSPIFEFPFQVGKLNINQIILADNLDEVVNIKPNDSGFANILNSSIPINNLGVQYVTSSFINAGYNFIRITSITKPSSSNLIVNKYGNDNNQTNEFSLFPINIAPKKSLYCIPSEFTNPAGTPMIGGNFASGASLSGSLLMMSGSIPSVVVLNDGTYVTGSLVSMTAGSSSIVNTISLGLSSGSRFFMSTYSNLQFPLTNGGAPITNVNWLDTTLPTDLGLNGRGIYEIVSCSISASVGILHNKGGGTFSNSKEFGTTNVILKQGCMIWEATKLSNYLLIEGSTQNLGTGNFVPSDVSPFIKDNLNTIVEKFGNKPKN